MTLAYRRRNSQFPTKSYLICILIILLGGLILTTILLASVPPVGRDALTHHLFVPKLWLKHGAISEIPEIVFSYYPMNLDLLYMIPLYFGNDIVPKYIHYLFALLTAWLIYRYLKKSIGSHYGLLGAIFFLSIPIIIKLSITVYVDLGLVFFSTASLLLLFRWTETTYQTKYLVLAGLCCGLAIGTKYNGLLVFFLLTCFIPFLYYRTGDSSSKNAALAIRASLLFVICTLLVVSPWLIRNTIWTGNPVYPLYDGFFNPQTLTIASATPAAKDIQGVFATRYALYGENIWQLLALPVRIFFEGMDDDPRYFDGRLNPFLLLLPLLAFMRGQGQTKQQRMEKVALLFFSLFYFLFAFNTGGLRIRYLAPMVPFLVILAMYGLHAIEITVRDVLPRKNLTNYIVALPVGLMLALNGQYLYLQFQYVDQISYLSGRLSRDEYIGKYRPEYQVMQYANTHLSESAKIVCLFIGRRGYYLNKDHIFEGFGGNGSLLTWLKEPGITVAEIIKRFEQQEITHILLRTDLFEQWRQQALPAKNQQTLEDLGKRHLVLLSANQNYILFQIKP